MLCPRRLRRCRRQGNCRGRRRYRHAGPPFLIQHGTADTSVSSKQAEKLHQALRAAGVDSKLILYPGVDHGFAKVGGGPDDAVNRRALEDVFDFLARFGS